MADPFESFSDSGSEGLQSDEFYKGLSFLGKPTDITLPGQEPSPPGGALSAGGASPSQPGPGGIPGSTQGSGSLGLPSQGLPPGLQALLSGAGFADRFASQIGSDLFSGQPAGAIETPSGQLTTGAPEVLRNQQFPEGTGLGEIPGASIGSFSPGGTGLGEIPGESIPSYTFGGEGLGSIPYASLLGTLPSAFGLGQGIAHGDPGGSINAASNLGIGLASALGAIPSGAVGPLGSWAGVLAAIIGDMISDPNGRVSSAQTANYLAERDVPGQAGALRDAASILPLISNNLSTEQAMQLYQAARAGLQSEGSLADPLAQQGTSTAGVPYASFPGLQQAVQQFSPEAWLATVRLQDLLASRGITPDQLPTPNVEQPFGQFFGYRTPQQNANLGAGWNLSEPGSPTGPGPLPADAPPSLWMQPAALLGAIGHYGGFTGQNMIGQVPPTVTYDAAGNAIGTAPLGPNQQPSQGFLYDPATMATLGALQPGGYEAGLRSYLSALPGYAASPLASILGAPDAAGAPAMASGPAQAQTAAAAPTGGLFDVPAPGVGDTEFPFGSA